MSGPGLSRRGLLKSIFALGGALVAASCNTAHEGPPAHQLNEPPSEGEEKIPPPVRAVREFQLPASASPAIVFRAKTEGSR